MAAPNLMTLTAVAGKSGKYSCTATLNAALTNPGSSNKIFKLNTIRAANIDTLAYTLDISVYDGVSHTYICKNLEIGQASSVVLLTKDESLYIQEGESIYAKASFANKIDLIFSYEELS